MQRKYSQRKMEIQWNTRYRKWTFPNDNWKLVLGFHRLQPSNFWERWENKFHWKTLLLTIHIGVNTESWKSQLTWANLQSFVRRTVLTWQQPHCYSGIVESSIGVPLFSVIFLPFRRGNKSPGIQWHYSYSHRYSKKTFHWTVEHRLQRKWIETADKRSKYLQRSSKNRQHNQIQLSVLESVWLFSKVLTHEGHAMIWLLPDSVQCYHRCPQH